jgi:hypothetical protein
MKILGFALFIFFVIGILAFWSWVPGENWSYLTRRRTKREIVIWIVLFIICFITILGRALFR